jgi:hypothetical protein
MLKMEEWHILVKWHLKYYVGIYFECNLAINLARLADSPDIASETTAIIYPRLYCRSDTDAPVPIGLHQRLRVYASRPLLLCPLTNSSRC